MKKYQKKILKLTTKQILLSFIDIAETLLKIFDKHRIYRRYYFEYEKWREGDKAKFYSYIYYLKRYQFIEVYKNEKGKFLQLTHKGKQKIAQMS